MDNNTSDPFATTTPTTPQAQTTPEFSGFAYEPAATTTSYDDSQIQPSKSRKKLIGCVVFGIIGAICCVASLGGSSYFFTANHVPGASIYVEDYSLKPAKQVQKRYEFLNDVLKYQQDKEAKVSRFAKMDLDEYVKSKSFNSNASLEIKYDLPGLSLLTAEITAAGDGSDELSKALSSDVGTLSSTLNMKINAGEKKASGTGSLSITTDAGTARVQADLLVNDQDIYFNLANLPTNAFIDATDVIGQWVKFDETEETNDTDEITDTIDEALDLTALIEYYNSKDVIDAVKALDDKVVAGVDSKCYGINITQDKADVLLLPLAKVAGDDFEETAKGLLEILESGSTVDFTNCFDKKTSIPSLFEMKANVVSEGAKFEVTAKIEFGFVGQEALPVDVPTTFVTQDEYTEIWTEVITQYVEGMQAQGGSSSNSDVPDGVEPGDYDKGILSLSKFQLEDTAFTAFIYDSPEDSVFIAVLDFDTAELVEQTELTTLANGNGSIEVSALPAGKYGIVLSDATGTESIDIVFIEVF